MKRSPSRLTGPHFGLFELRTEAEDARWNRRRQDGPMKSTPDGVAIRAYDPARDEAWATELLGGALAGRIQARRGELIDVLDAEGLVAELDGRPAGLLTFRPDDPDPAAIELTVLAVASPGKGVGSALVSALADEAGRRRATRIWLVTTNDNLDALRLYQRRGFRLTGLRAGAVDQARIELKPSIGDVAANGIPIRDELDLELDLEL
jgi:ribosomal protein S18 acetylase RimI-like enzyme